MHSTIISRLNQTYSQISGWKVTFKIKNSSARRVGCEWVLCLLFAHYFKIFQRMENTLLRKTRNVQSLYSWRSSGRRLGEPAACPSAQISRGLKRGRLGTPGSLSRQGKWSSAVRRVNKISLGLQVIHSRRSESVRLLSLVEEQQNSITE